MVTTIENSAYLKIFLHSAKYSTSSIGGYLIGWRKDNVCCITDVIPICHTCPCGPMFEISAEMTEQIYNGTESKILGYYFAKESETSSQPAYIEKIVQSIKKNTGGPSLLFEVKNELISQADVLMLKASLEGAAIEISLSTGTAKAVNNTIDHLLAQNYHRMLIDFEDHMDSAAAMSNGKVIGDFRNKFITQAILDLKI